MSESDVAAGSPESAPHKNIALTVIAIAQLMIVVDASIVSIALPVIQHDLGISTANRQWVVTAYTLAFGGLLLLGGRIGDFLGRRRMFQLGLVGFAAASGIGGIADSGTVLFAARAGQGVFAALMAPAALGLLTVTFTEPKERARAFSVFSAIAGSGLALGLVAGGLLVQYVSWRWCLLVNIPIALAAAIASQRYVPESRSDEKAHYDIPGALTASIGLAALVYAMTKAGENGWGNSTTLVCLAVAAVLLVSFVLIEQRVSEPMLPLGLVTNRNRGGALATSILLNAGVFGLFVFLSIYLQESLGYSAVKAGLAVLPFSAGIVISAGAASRIMLRVPPRFMMTGGLLVAAGGFLLLSGIGVHSSYLGGVLPGLLVMSLGMGVVFVPITSVSLLGVPQDDAGAASAAVNASQQIGGSIGTGLLNSVAISATASYVASHAGKGIPAKQVLAHATVHGYSEGFVTSAALLAGALIIAGLFVNAGTEDLPSDAVAVA